MGVYLHVLDGRIRVKVPEVKGDSQQASGLEHVLLSTRGVSNVKANPLTGNVLILFNAEMVDQKELLGIIKRFGSFAVAGKRVGRRTSPSERAVVNYLVARLVDYLMARLVDRVVQLALERLILALI